MCSIPDWLLWNSGRVFFSLNCLLSSLEVGKAVYSMVSACSQTESRVLRSDRCCDDIIPESGPMRVSARLLDLDRSGS